MVEAQWSREVSRPTESELPYADCVGQRPPRRGTHVSNDDGRSWRMGNIIDLGGRGHYNGAMEATLAELCDGRMYMLLRTNLDRFSGSPPASALRSV